MLDVMMKSLEKTWSLFWERLLFFTPRLMAAIVVVVVGLLAAWLLKTIFGRILRASGFDAGFQRLGWTAVLERAGVQKPASACAASALFWLLFLMTVMLSLTAFELPILDRLATGFFLFLPRLAVAIAIVVAGSLLAGFLGRSVLVYSVNAELPLPGLVAATVRALVLGLGAAMALEQVGIATAIVTTAFGLTFGGLMLALALAFGLGGRQAARDLLQRATQGRTGAQDHLDHL